MLTFTEDERTRLAHHLHTVVGYYTRLAVRYTLNAQTAHLYAQLATDASDFAIRIEQVKD